MIVILIGSPLDNVGGVNPSAPIHLNCESLDKYERKHGR